MDPINQHVIELKESIASIEAVQKQHSKDSDKQVNALTGLAKEISNLVSEMKARDVKNETLQVKVDEIEEEHEAIKKEFGEYKTILNRAKLSQDRWDNLVNSIYSNTGKAVFILMLVGAALVLGLDLSKIGIK